MNQSNESPQRTRHGRRWARVILALAIVLVVGLGLATIFAPAIASAIAPGVIERAANKQIEGHVKVKRLSLSWNGPLVVGPVELYDDTGKLVGEGRATAAPGLWKIVSEQWWSRRDLDVGTIEVTGNLDVVGKAGGTNTLKRAIASKGPATPATSQGSPLDSLKATIKLVGVNVTYRDEAAPAGSPLANGVGITGFGGDVGVSYVASGQSAVKADLQGAVKGAQDKVTLTADVGMKQSATGTMDHLDAKIDLAGVPIDLIDGLGGFGGELARSIGPSGDVHIAAAGNADKANATLRAQTEGATADVVLEYADGVLHTTAPGLVRLRSTSFIAQAPSLRDTVQQVGRNLRLDSGPPLEIQLTALSLPVPRSAIGLGKDAAAGTDKGIDLRAGSADITLTLGAMQGSINTSAISGGAAAGAEQFRPLAIEPLRVHLEAPTLGGAKHITAQTSAAIDGATAGRLDVDLAAYGLFDDTGRFDAARLEKAEGQARLLGVTTTLLQPLAEAISPKLDLSKDVGPTVDVVLRPTTAPASAGKLPPTDVNLTVTSANIAARGDIRYDDGAISTTGDGLAVRVASAGPLASRFLASPGAEGTGTLAVSGKLPIELRVRDLLIDRTGKPAGLAGIRAHAEVRASDAGVTLTMAKPADGQPAPAPAAPIMLGSAVISASLEPGKPTRLALDASMSHGGAPFKAEGSFTATGLGASAGGTTPAQGQIGRLLGLGISGRLDLKDVPRSLADLVPAAAAALNPTGDDTSAAVKRLVSDLVGPSVDATLTTAAPGSAGGAQSAKVDLAASGISATATARLSESELSLDVLSAQARLTPEQTAGALAALTPRPTAAPGAAPRQAPVPMALGAPVTFMLSTQPVKIRLKPGTTEPDLASIGEAVVSVNADKPVLISNIPVKGKQESLGFGSPTVTARIPVTLYVSEKPDANPMVRAFVKADLLRPPPGVVAWTSADGATMCAKLETDVAIPMKDAATAEKYATVRLNNVDNAALSPLTGDPLLLPGTLGDTVQLTANLRYGGDEKSGARIGVNATIEAPRLQGATISASTQGDVFTVNAAKMNWTPGVDWINKVAFTPATKAGETPAGATDQLAQETTFTIDVRSLAMSMPKTGADGTPVQGPLKPGVFVADLGVTAPLVVIRRADGKTVRAEDIRVALTGGRTLRPGSLGLDASIARVIGDDPNAGSRASSVKGTIDNLADDRGVVNTSNAVLNLTSTLEAFPTPLIDSVAGMNGKVVDLLGSFLDLNLTASGLALNGSSGSLSAIAKSPRAGAQLKGSIQDHTFVQDGTFQIDVYEMVRYEIARKLPGGMPLVAFIEKKKGSDKPGVIRAEGLRIPTDKDMRKLNGVISVDPGTATFEFNDAFSRILRELSQKERGQVGRRLEPFVVNIRDGIASYDKFTLKAGEFDVQTSGSANLVNRTIDVVTYVPAGAVTEEILNIFKGTLGANAKGFTQDTRFPFTTKGPLDNPKTAPDLGLFVKENAGKLIQDVGGKALEDLLKKLNK